MSGKRTFLWVMAGIFGVLALVFYFTSIKEVSGEASRYLGVSAVANVQGTVFAAACAVLCGINIVGAIVLGGIEDTPSSGPSSGHVANEVARVIEEKERKKEEEAKKKLEDEERQARIREKQEAARAKRENGQAIQEGLFIDEIAEEKSMIKIWQIWQGYGLAEEYPEVNEKIQGYKDYERIYGKLNDIEKIKAQIKDMLLPG